MAPEDLLVHAARLCAGTAEVEWRDGAGRAYYGAFHLARRLLKRWGFQVPHSDRAHSYLWLRLNNAGNPKLAKAGADLNDVRRLRNVADYDLDAAFTQAHARLVLLAAQDVQQRLAEVAQDPSCPTLIDAIKSYERDVLKDVTAL